MSTALVTGTTDRVGAVATALQTEGFETLALDRWNPGAAAPVQRGSVNCYVQLPAGSSSATGPGGNRGSIGTHALVARVDAVAAVSPLLAHHAAVLLVADDPGWDRRRRDALHLLAEATVADYARGAVRVAVLDEHSSPVDIAATARRESTPARRESAPASAPSLADLAPDLGYADWRSEVFSLTGGTERTYFGWVGGDGGLRVAILRGTVVSPLRPVGAATESGSLFSWGHSDPSAHMLARALLADTLGADTRCLRCRGTGSDCPACRGSGLMGWVGDLAGVFVEEVVRSFPLQGFELRVGDVAAWIDRHRVPPAASAAPGRAAPALLP